MRAWRPRVPGVREVLHADFIDHAYPPHTHDEWTLLLIDEGEVAYALDGAPRRASARTVSLLPPQVAHDGRSARAGGFRKRVLYLDGDWLDPDGTGRTVDHPVLPATAGLVASVHAALAHPGDELAAEALLLRVRDRALAHVRRRPLRRMPPAGTARALRDLLDARVVDGVTLADAGRLLGVHPASLGRAFTDAFGITPHRYLIGRRVDRARHLLTDGWPPAEAAAASGFFDQAHLTRHFTRTLGISPAAYARGSAG
jgi:AraC-like DNA-binding protein